MTPEQLAAQLRCPHGEDADDVGLSMNRANGALTLRSIALLDPAPGQRVLEIGPGNAAFATQVVHHAPGVQYTGLDLSAEMVAAATRLNRALVDDGRAAFVPGSAEQLPFADACFERIFSVNTLYFWTPAEPCLHEIRRVITPDGVLCLAFGHRDFMAALPFAAHGFTLYDEQEASALLDATGWQVTAIDEHLESVRSNTGEAIQRRMLIVRARPV